MAASRNRKTVTIAKPGQIRSPQSNRSLRNQASEVEEHRDRRRPGRRPAAAPTAAPLASFVTLLGDLRLGELDLLADEQRGLLGDLGDDLAEVLVGARAGGHAVAGSSGQPPQDQGERKPAGEGGADERLGALGERVAARSRRLSGVSPSGRVARGALVRGRSTGSARPGFGSSAISRPAGPP